MKIYKNKKLVSVLVLALAAVLLFSACSSAGGGDTSPGATVQAAVAPGTATTDTASGNAPATSAANVRLIQVAIKPDLFPISSLDDSGKPVGYDIELAQLIDEALPEYEFEYVPLSQEAILLGVETGKYPVAISGFAKSPARAEKYLFPEENIGAVTFGLILRKENSDITTLEGLADHPELKLAPIASASQGQIILEGFNTAHPDKPIAFEVGEWSNTADTLKWIADGRYDVALGGVNGLKSLFDELSYNDKLVFNPTTGNPTWSLFNKDEAEFAAAYDRELKKLKDDGVAKEKIIKFFGEDLFESIKAFQ